MIDIATAQIVIGVITAIVLGGSTAFVYWQSHRKEVEKTNQELWPKLEPFRAMTTELLTIAIRVMLLNKSSDPQFSARYALWLVMLAETQGLMGSKGRRRAIEIALMFEKVGDQLAYPAFPLNWVKPKETPLFSDLQKAQGELADDPHYFNR